MFQFRRFPSYAYLIQRRMTEYCSAGFPHSEIFGSTPMCGSPKLIAACHVLHRLLMPRHSPCALFSLTSPARLSRPSLPALAESLPAPPRLLSKSVPLRLGPNLDDAPRRFHRFPESSPDLKRFWFSKELCRHKSVHCSLCYPLKVHKLYFVTSLLLARNFLLHCSVFKVQGSSLKARSKRSDVCPNASIRPRGGGYRTRTGDPLLAKQVLYQLS